MIRAECGAAAPCSALHAAFGLSAAEAREELPLGGRRRDERGSAIAVVGATGAVGTVMLQCLKERGLDRDNEIVLFATARSAGKVIDGRTVLALDDDADISGFDIALFSAGGGTSKQWAPRFVRGRRDRDRQLVGVPPRSGRAAGRLRGQPARARRGHHGLIANPNCSTMQLMVALAPIHREVGIERLIVSTYQSVSGTGQKAIAELEAEARAALEGEPMPAPAIYPEQIAFNVIGAAGNFVDGDDHTDEERKMMFETRKILEDDSIGVAVTCVRVPVRTGHSESVNIQTREHLDGRARRRTALTGARADREDVPTPLRSEGRDEVYVGRIRRDESHPNGLSMFVVADNLRKGAATNAVQIAELLIRDGIVAASPSEAVGAGG